MDYARIQYLCSPEAEAMPDGERLTQLVNMTRELLERHDQRVSELLEANNRELGIRRSAIRRLGRLQDAVLALYAAAYWTADREADDEALWSEVRDAAEIPPGTSPRRLGSEESFRRAVVDELVICHIYSRAHDCDPRKAIADIINWNVGAALDPAVSAEARKLAGLPDEDTVI
jgi:hypothetical protein